MQKQKFYGYLQKFIKKELKTLAELLKYTSVVALPGLRQCGKMILVNHFFEKRAASIIHFLTAKTHRDPSRI